jgi:hypothetical protein
MRQIHSNFVARRPFFPHDLRLNLLEMAERLDAARR